MTADFSEFVFSVPYEMAAIRPLRQTTRRERQSALRAAGYNTELIPQELIYIDLKTDSGVSAPSTGQLAELLNTGPKESGIEMASEGSAVYRALAKKFKRFLGFPKMVPVAQGRAAERLWTKLHVQPGSVVPGNMLFPSTRYHIEAAGGTVLDVINDGAHDLISDAPFKGDIDLVKLAAAFRQHQQRIACVYVELCVNSCGGHPVSLGNLRAVRDAARAANVPLFLDASRIIENSCLVKQREPDQANRRLAEIVRETCELADACTMSALKDFSSASGGFIGMRDEGAFQKAYMQSFLDGVQAAPAVMAALQAGFDELEDDAYAITRVEQPEYLWRQLKDAIPVVQPPGAHAVFIDMGRFMAHVARENYPAEALAAYVFEASGIRLTKGPPLAPSQTARGMELLRIAIPARRYLQAHLDDVAAVLLHAYSRRETIKGLIRVLDPGRSKYAPARFTPLEQG
jgi:tyrosine phenol-lyase